MGVRSWLLQKGANLYGQWKGIGVLNRIVYDPQAGHLEVEVALKGEPGPITITVDGLQIDELGFSWTSLTCSREWITSLIALQAPEQRLNNVKLAGQLKKYLDLFA